MKKTLGTLVSLLLWTAGHGAPLGETIKAFGQQQTSSDMTLYFPDFVDGDGWSVQLALSNTAADSDDASVSIRVYDSEGAAIRHFFDSSHSLEIPSLGSRILRSSGSGAIRRGWIEVETDLASVSGLLTYRHAQSGVEVGVKPAEMGNQFALFVEESSDIGTGLAIFKPESEPAIELRIRDEGGEDPLDGMFVPRTDFHHLARTMPEWFGVEGVDTGFLRDFRGLLFLRSEDGSLFAPLGLRFGKQTGSLSAVPVIRGGDVSSGMPPSGTGGAPPTVRLSAAPTSIERGQSADLRWSSTNAISASITPGVGTVLTSGSRRVSPTRTTTYRITVRGADGQTSSASTTVTVKSDFEVASNSPLRVIPLDYFPDGAVESADWFTLPEQSTYDAGKRLFYYDYYTPGASPEEATIVLVHGNPESSYTFRDLRAALIASGRPMRIVAMDHIGFGLSDQADFEMVDMHHAENLLALVRHLDLRDVTLAVHDWGGAIGIGAFAQEPDRVRNLLVMNTTIFPMPEEGITYTNFPSVENPWSSTPDRIPDEAWGGLAAAVILDTTNNLPAALASFISRFQNNLFAEGSVEHVFSEPFRSVANVRSSKRNVRQTPFWGHGYTYDDSVHGLQDNSAFYDHIQEVVSREWGVDGRNLDASGHFGRPDPVGKAEVIAQWHEALPRMVERTFTYPDAGHFVEEVKGPEIAQSILEMNWPRDQ